MTVLVTVNRYLAVCRPYAASDTNAIRRQARLHIALVAAFSVLFNVTRFFEYQIEEIEDSGLHATPTWLYSNLWYQVYTWLITSPSQRTTLFDGLCS